MANKMKIELLGAKELGTLLARSGPAAIPALTQALNEEAQLGMRASQKIVPHADGILRGSGTIQPPVISGHTVSITMGYGGAAKRYALAQHELPLTHPDPTNPKSSPLGQMKYLEAPMRARLKNIEKNIAKRIERILGGAA